MASKKDNLLDWLKDAHAMEQQAEQMLSAQASRLENYPKLRTRIQQHLEETRGQQQLLETALRNLGSEPSTLKDLGGKLMAFGQAVGGMAVSDEVIKGAMAGYVFENVEIAAYTVLIEAAKVAGEVEAQKACEKILPQEIAMAEWLKEHLVELTHAFLERSEAPGVEAKR